MVTALRTVSRLPVITILIVAILTLVALLTCQRTLPSNLLVTALAQMRASINSSKPIGSVILPMVLAAIFIPQLLLPTLLILLRNRAPLKFFPCLQSLFLNLLLH